MFNVKLRVYQFSITRGVASAVVGITSPVVDHAFFGGNNVSGLVLGSAVATAITLAEQLTLAPLHIGEYITSGSLLAAHSSINVLSVIFPGSSEASFSLASFFTLVKREWNDPNSAIHLPDRKFGFTEMARAIVAWVALQGVTQEWQEKDWLEHLKEIRVEDYVSDSQRHQRVGSRVRVTSDVIFPGNRGQLISADIGEAPATCGRAMSSTLYRNGPARMSLSAATAKRVTLEMPKPKDPTEMKATLRRLSKMVLAGYGGASLLFFGMGPEFTAPQAANSTSGPSNKKKSEEIQLENAIDASEAEASGVPLSSSAAGDNTSYSWWDILLGRHDKEIFERYANAPVDQQTQHARHAQETWRRKKAQMKNEAVIGIEHQMPRYWVLTDHGRSQIVLVLRGTMSLNELAVDLTCEPVDFEPAAMEDETSEQLPTASSWISGIPFPSPSSFRQFPRKSFSSTTPPRYHVHGGMLKMARIMGEVGKPVHLAVREALSYNPEYELVLCGHSLGAGVAAMLGLVRFSFTMLVLAIEPWCGVHNQMWADPKTCCTVRSSGLPIGHRVSVYCFAPPCATFLSHPLVSLIPIIVCGQVRCGSRTERTCVEFDHLIRILARCSFTTLTWVCQGHTERSYVALRCER
jgi:hypothetical protein